MSEELKLRNQFVFLLNCAVDITKKNEITEEDMLNFSNEVRAFRQFVNILNIDNNLKRIFSNIEFYYSSTQKDFLSVLPLVFTRPVQSVLNPIFYTFRRNKVSKFLNINDKKLSLLEQYK